MANVMQGMGTATVDEGLHKAIERAWDDAKAKGGQPGRYTVHKIEIEASNPIHSYIVTIGP